MPIDPIFWLIAAIGFLVLEGMTFSMVSIWFAGGALFGSAGIKLLTSKDAKKAYTHATAAVLRMKDSVMETANLVQENCGDILADAKDINEARAAAAEQVVDAAEPAE